MPAGRQLSKDLINNDAYSVVRNVFAALDGVAKFKLFLDATPDATLTGTYGFVQGDVDQLKSAFTDLNKLKGVFEGTQTQGSTYDFRSFSKLLLGDGLY